MDLSTSGKRLAAARKAAGLTQKQAADKAGIDSITLSRYERDAQPMSIHRAGSVADLYGVPRVWITDGVGPVPDSVASHNDPDPAPEAA